MIVAVLVILTLVAIVIFFRSPIQGAFEKLFDNFFSSVNSSAGMSAPTLHP
jgi:hypothetical protein